MISSIFSKDDLKQIAAKGIDPKVIEAQIDNFRRGFPFINLDRPAIVGDGIKTFNLRDAKKLSYYYDSNSKKYEVLKFVPASGAASRMFKDLFEFIDTYTGSEADIEKLNSDKKLTPVRTFISRIRDFAFYSDLQKVLRKEGFDLEECLQKHDYKTIIEYLLTKKGLNYASQPKGVLQFHKYENESRMSIEEHLVEGANYCKDKEGRAAIHFTVSPEHADTFLEEINRIKDKYEELFDVTYELTFSLQKASTDTIAVDLKDKPFRETDGSLVFRPGGHGALIENLNDRESEIIFIKNIDNVVPDRMKPDTFLYKKVLGGYLFELQDMVIEHIETLEDRPDDEDIRTILRFIKSKLGFIVDPDFNTFRREDKIEYLIRKLNRPIRVCGMVKNEGEPGGGPFWVKEHSGEISLQIVESSQINMDDEVQKSIFSKSTHFNPVDIVCAVRDYKGHNFDLRKYINPETGFISTKSKDGKSLKAQELPGLWNGAMADWITVFVEVPISTFNPVKTINDLLRAEHQQQG
ncbi:MAG: DUF4301 family protein [Bacteroidales bacterium]|nr:DUF4301 family protein [Bacteroidales bacterium]